MLRYLFLALLAARPRHGYELKAAFEELMGGTWTLNIGQVYTGLSKLEQDGLIAAEVVPQELLPDRKVYSLTETGAKELERWLEEPDTPPVRLRDEFFLKVMAQVVSGSGDPAQIVWQQREQFLRTLAQLSALRADPSTHPATELLLEGAMLRLEADLKWLDLCEDRLTERR